MLAVVYGLKQLAQDGLGVVPVAVDRRRPRARRSSFVRRQSRLADPLIDLRLFRVPAFSASLAVYTLGILVLFGSFLFIYQYLQLVLELSPLMAGSWTLPSFGSFVVGSMLAPALVKRVRPAYVMAGGLAIAAVGLLCLTQVSAEAGLGVLVGASVVYSLGHRADLHAHERPHHRRRAARAGRRGLGDLGDGRRARRRAQHRGPRHARHRRLPDAGRRRHPGGGSGRCRPRRRATRSAGRWP